MEAELQTQDIITQQPKTKRSKLSILFVLAFGFICFVVFLLLKLPETRIQNLVVAHLKIISQQQGFTFNAEKVKVGMFLGPHLKFYNIELKSMSDSTQTLKIDFLKVKPGLLAFAVAKQAFAFDAELLDGTISGSFQTGTGETSIALNIDKMNTAKTNLIKNFIPVDVAGKISGKIDMDYSAIKPETSSGNIDLQLKDVTLPAQSIMGLNLPQIKIAESVIAIVTQNGKSIFRSFQVGKNIQTDGVVGNLSGEMQLDKFILNSKLNLKAAFDLSKSIKESLPLLDSLLSAGKTPDGKYSFQIGGTLGMPIPRSGL